MTPGGNITLSYGARAISNEKYTHACESVFCFHYYFAFSRLWLTVESAGRLLVSKVTGKSISLDVEKNNHCQTKCETNVLEVMLLSRLTHQQILFSMN